jgi:hypothetical protein
MQVKPNLLIIEYKIYIVAQDIKTPFNKNDYDDFEARKEFCETFGVKFSGKISEDSFQKTEGILSKYLTANEYIDPVEIVKNTRRN